MRRRKPLRDSTFDDADRRCHCHPPRWPGSIARGHSMLNRAQSGDACRSFARASLGRCSRRHRGADSDEMGTRFNLARPSPLPSRPGPSRPTPPRGSGRRPIALSRVERRACTHRAPTGCGPPILTSPGQHHAARRAARALGGSVLQGATPAGPCAHTQICDRPGRSGQGCGPPCGTRASVIERTVGERMGVCQKFRVFIAGPDAS